MAGTEDNRMQSLSRKIMRWSEINVNQSIFSTAAVSCLLSSQRGGVARAYALLVRQRANTSYAHLVLTSPQKSPLC